MKNFILVFVLDGIFPTSTKPCSKAEAIAVKAEAVAEKAECTFWQKKCPFYEKITEIGFSNLNEVKTD